MQSKFSEMCRLCLRGHQEFVFLFEKKALLLEKIAALFSTIKVEEGDGLPAQVCLQCVNQLNASYDFKVQCEKADAILRKDFTETFTRSRCPSPDGCTDNSDLTKLEQERNEELREYSGLSRDDDENSDSDIPNDDNSGTEAVEDVPYEKSPEKSSTSSSEKNTKTNKKQNQCTVCGKYFLSVLRLKRHYLTHNLPGQEFECRACGKKFTDSEKYKAHRRDHASDTVFKCDICSKVFSKLFNLEQHRPIHTGDRPHECLECGKKFRHQSHLIEHIRQHTGEKPYTCEVCGKTFATSPELTKHLRVHSGDKPYACEVCGRTFRVNSHLMVHKRLHTGAKPYICDVCGKAFRHRRTLETHKLVHTGEKPHLCAVCGKGFTKAWYLKNHILKHTGEMPHECKICGKTYRLAVSLKCHVQKHEAMERAANAAATAAEMVVPVPPTVHVTTGSDTRGGRGSRKGASVTKLLKKRANVLFSIPQEDLHHWSTLTEEKKRNPVLEMHKEQSAV